MVRTVLRAHAKLFCGCVNKRNNNITDLVIAGIRNNCNVHTGEENVVFSKR